MPSSRPPRGQATIDYVALVAVLAVLLATAATLVGGGATGVANAILGQIRHALCIVTGGACSLGRQPCVVASDRDAHHVAVTIAIVRLDGDRYVLRERLSDGTVRLTLAHRAGGGVEVGIGSLLRLRIRGRQVSTQREARGGAEAVLGYGEVYLARDDREADEILRALGGRGGLPIGGGGPQPHDVFVEGGGRALGGVGLGGQAAGASLEGIGDAILGARRDERNGNVTVAFNAGSSGWALLSAVMAGPSGATDRQVGFGLTLDRRRRPIELSLSASGTLAAGSTLPTAFAGPLGVGGGDDAALHLRGRRWELSARVDLRDPEVAAAWAAFRRHPSDPDALRALAALLRTRAQLDVRSYAVSSESDGAAAGLAFGLRFGGELDHTTEHSRLLSAATRPPGGLWERRWDCVAA